MRPCLVDDRVAAGNIVLRNAVELRDAAEVVAQVLLRLHADHLLKVNQRLRQVLYLQGCK